MEATKEMTLSQAIALKTAIDAKFLLVEICIYTSFDLCTVKVNFLKRMNNQQTNEILLLACGYSKRIETDFEGNIIFCIY